MKLDQKLLRIAIIAGFYYNRTSCCYYNYYKQK